MITPRLPERLYVVVGIADPEGRNVPYPTDPRSYGLDTTRWQIPVEELDGKYRDCVHAYREVRHAIDAIYRCGLEPPGSFLNVFARSRDGWQLDRTETDRILDETPW